MHKINWPIVALIVANLIWGAASPIFKYSLENIPPFSLAFLRFLIASIVLYPFIHHCTSYSDLKDKKLWLFALTGTTLNIIFFFLALQRTASINAPIIASGGPIFVLIASVIFLHEKARINEVLGMSLALIGIIIIVIQPLLQTGPSTELTGNLLMVLATLAAIINTIIGRKILTLKNTLGHTFWSFFIATISFLPLAIWEYSQNPYWLAQLDGRGYLGIAFGSLLCSLTAYTLFDWALAKLPAHKVSIFSYIDPVVAVLIAVPLLGEKITPVFLFGSILVFLGILIAEKRLNYHPLHKLFNKTNNSNFQ